jgi:exosortase/archaeosortase family protein
MDRRSEASRQLRYLAALLLLAPALLAGYTLPRDPNGPAGHLIASYFRFYARLGAAIIRPIEPAARAIGSEIHGNALLNLARGRDAIDIILPFTAAVLAFPATFRRRATGIGIAVLSLAEINLLRIMCLYWLALENAAAFEVAQGDIFPVLMMTLAIVGFLAWARWASSEGTSTR